MKRVFADTGYWVALLNPSDELHSKALEVSRRLGPVRIYTPEMVLVEVANMLGKAGENFRALVQQTVASLRACLKTLTRRRVRARGLQELGRIVDHCRPGAHTGRVFKQALRQNPNVTIEPQTSTLFREALDFYAAHKDKNWSLTDCASFLVMKGEGITEALAYDHHFEQAGFVASLRAVNH